jgi:cytochrome b
MIREWDPLVRVLHWGLVAAFALAWLTAEEGEACTNWRATPSWR